MSFWELLESHEDVASTMALARLRALDGAPEGTTVSARSQSAGRGRRGRSWFSPTGGLYLTTVLRPTGAAPEALPQLALVAGLAVRAACETEGAAGARLKWPNDILVGRKKLAGILLESIESNVVLVGIGVNLQERGDVDLPEEVTLRFIGLADLVEGSPDRLSFTQGILTELETRYGVWRESGFEGLHEEFERFHCLTGTEIRAQHGDSVLEGEVERVDHDGALLIRTQNGVERVRSGEVSALRF
ncbi:MAG: biotin--[acetyl-CoA-carboxylase] ligase [Myxococcota bacterium]